MREIIFYLDFVSPYAWLAFQQLPDTLEGVDVHVRYRPIVLGALLKQHHNPGPAGLPSKRVWTYRHVQWLAQRAGIPLHMPTTHPFNPLPLLRLAQQCAFQGETSRWVTETLFRHVWEGGGDPLAPERLAQLSAQLEPHLDSHPEAPLYAKQQLRDMTQAALASGVFGVPTFLCEGHLFWGLDSLPMLRDYLRGNAHFDGVLWQAAAEVPSGLKESLQRPA